MSSNKNVTIDETWANLQDGLIQLISKLNEGLSKKKWMLMYTAVYNYCTSSNTQTQISSKTQGANFVGEELYKKLKDFLTEHMNTLNQGAQDRMDEGLLNYYNTEWSRYTTAMKYINNIFEYLNRHWVKREADDGKKEVYKVYTLSIVIWREHFFNQVKKRLTSAILALVEKERNGEQIDTYLVDGVIKSYVSLGLSKEKPSETTLSVYKEQFEAPFLLATQEFYISESTHFISINTVADFMKKVETRLHEEQERVRQYLHSDTEKELISTCESVLIERHKEAIAAEFQPLLENDKVEDLPRMYNLLSRIHKGLDPLKNTLEKHVQTKGLLAVQNVASSAITDPKLYVETLLGVYKKYNDLVVNAFVSDPGFVASLDKACRRFINDNAVCKAAKSASKSPELLARYSDQLLKKSSKLPGERELDDILNDVMTVFKYIEDKDVFQTFYSKMLAKRLIHGTSSSEDMEGNMIVKLRSTCGYEYTSKLQRMFTDMSLSRDLMKKFLKKLLEPEKIDLKIDFNVLVLATGSWPLQPPSTNFSIPKELEFCEQLFQKFYQNEHTGRKLNWLHQLSKGELKTRFTSGKTGYTLQASTYQMGILLQFNNQDSISVEELQIATQLTDSILKMTLLSLIKSKILLQEPDGEITKTTKYKLNYNFKSKKTKVNINIPVPQQVKEESESTHKSVEEDRKLQIQAAIVRIMKMRKTIQHSSLISEVVSQLQSRFKPKINSIKKCIDILIEKEYLERQEGQKDMYSYVA